MFKNLSHENECWVDTPNFPNHQVSTHGRVRNKKTGHILKPIPDRYGYLRLSIGSVDNVPVHRLVCETFYGPPPEGKTQVNHFDCDRQNNHIFNLGWCSPSENIKWAVYKGNIDMQKLCDRASEVNKKPVKIVELGIIFKSVKDCADFLKINPNRVSRVLAGERKGQRLHGYHLEYVEEVS